MPGSGTTTVNCITWPLVGEPPGNVAVSKTVVTPIASDEYWSENGTYVLFSYVVWAAPVPDTQ